MKQRIEQLRTRIDNMTLRERAMLFAAVVVVLFMLWDALLMAPLEAEREQKVSRLESVKSELENLNLQIQHTVSGKQQDPNDELRRQLAQTESAVAALDRSIGEHLGRLIDPQQMARVLERMLLEQTALTPVRVESLGSAPLIEQTEVADVAGVFRHRLLLEMEGSYPDAVDYLSKLQALPWSFYWAEVSIEMQEYPRARIRLVVSTLSLKEGWIGA